MARSITDASKEIRPIAFFVRYGALDELVYALRYVVVVVIS